MNGTLPRVSDEAVQKATGKTWAEWFTLLDQAKAQEMTHKEIVAWLYKRHIESGWWSQMVTNAYEKARKNRVVGETLGTGFQIGVQKTVDISPEQAWKLINSPEGRRIWLGEIGQSELVPGEIYETAEGIKGEVRVLREGEYIRITWQLPEWNKPSTLQVRVIPAKDKTAFHFHQENLAGEEEREAMRGHWQKILGELEKLIKSPLL